jgi:putative serine protease PepD
MPAGSVEQVAAKVSPSVVKLQISMGQQGEEGSGIVLTGDGLILTNNHVVAAAAGDEQGAQSFSADSTDGGAVTKTVTFSNGQTVPFTVVGTDPTGDLAVVRAQGASGLTPIAIGSSKDVKVGQQVVAIGSPLGLQGTVTTGIVSALDRPVAAGDGSSGNVSVLDAIQTDAAINPGNSGGALVNARGELIGINSAIVSETGGYQGIGFAVPSNLARHVMDDLLKYGEVQRGAIPGVVVVSLTTQLADELGAASTRGALINQMTRQSDAYTAGLRPGDIIVSFNGRPVDDASAFMRMLADSKVGTSARLEILRESRRLEVTVPVTRSRSTRTAR